MHIEENRAQIIPENQADFPAQREYAAQRGELNPPFGKHHLTSINTIKTSGLSAHEKQQYLNDVYKGTREYLQHAYLSSDQKVFVERLFYDGIDNPNITHILHEHGIDTFSLTPETLFDRGILPDNALDQLLQIHLDNFAARSLAFEKSLPEKLHTFMDSLERLKEIGIETIDLSVCEKRLENTAIHVADGLSQRFTEQYGVYENGTQSIYISESALLDEELADAALTHELLHVCAGKEIINIPNPAYGWLDDEPSHHTHNLKNGLGIHIIGTPYKKYSWLDEAITQTITELLTKKQTQVYWWEKVLQATLVLSGKESIPPLLFMNAYFENYDTSAKPNLAQPAHKELYHAINNSYQPGFLAAVDNYVQSHNEFDEHGTLIKDGVNETFKQLHADWKIIAEAASNKSTE